MIGGDYIDTLNENTGNQLNFKLQSRDRIYLNKLNQALQKSRREALESVLSVERRFRSRGF